MHNDVAAPSRAGAAGAALEGLFEVAVRLDEAIDQRLAEEGLTRARAEVIWRLQHGGPMTQRELSEALRCSPRNVTGLVDALEGSGLAARNPHPSDRRATLVSLTRKGTRAATSWQAGYGDLGEDLFADLSLDDVQHLAGTLAHVVARLRARTSSPVQDPSAT